MGSSTRRVAVLFIYHQEFEACQERIRLLRRLNPEVALYGLYGGALEDLPATEPVAALLDDHWSYPYPPPSKRWKWLNVDRLIATWYMLHGQNLAGWERVLIHPWDTLYLEPVTVYTDPLESERQVMIYPQLLNEAELKLINWVWLEDPQFAEFKQYLQDTYPEPVRPVGIPMFTVAFSRLLLDTIAYLLIKVPGMCEYRFPTLAEQFGFEVLTPSHLPRVKLSHQPPGFLWPEFANPVREEVSIETLVQAFQSGSPVRLFHPVYDFSEATFDQYFQMTNTGKILLRQNAMCD